MTFLKTDSSISRWKKSYIKVILNIVFYTIEKSTKIVMRNILCVEDGFEKK